MKPYSKEVIESIIKFLTNRLFILFAFCGVFFYILIVTLFNIQIVQGEYYAEKAKKSTISKELKIAAPRGEIYDRYGRPLAINKVAFMIKIDPSVNDKLSFEKAQEFIKLMERNGEKLIDDFPISKEEPFVFLLSNSTRREERWKEDMRIKKDATAQEAFEKLRDFFGVPESLSNEEARKVLSLCSTIYMQRYSGDHITIAVNVKDITVSGMEEKKQDFPGFYVEVDYLREYPQGETFAHMLGYIRNISEDDLKEKQAQGSTDYDSTSIVGQAGLERAFESELKGKDGKRIVQNDSSGIRVSSERMEEPMQGNSVMLTVDSELQNKTYDILKNQLKQIILNKMRGLSSKEAPITSRDAIIGMIKGNSISVDYILDAKEGTYAYDVKKYIEENSGLDKADEKYKSNVRKFIIAQVEANKISMGALMIIMHESGVISLTDEEIVKLSRGNGSVSAILIYKIEHDEITPQMINVDPYSGSVVVVDVKTGDVITAVSYPSYDNNEFVNNFNNDYYYKLINDATTPMVYRAFSEPRAPGSTFKMITAVAGLESGAITTNTLITDKGEFTEAGKPYLKCWIRSYPYHGTINVSSALEVSCNYFFNETSYRMGNTKQGKRLEGIAELDRYITAFGLGDRSGVEISELYDSKAYTNLPNGIKPISSPEYKLYIEQSRNPDKTEQELRWTDGNTVATAIGQGYNNYTVASMAKYIATLATKGDRYQLHFLDKVVSSSGKIVREFEPVIEEHVDMKESTVKAVYDGMLAVTKGNNGTAKVAFKDFPIKIGAKTGTAQETRAEHTSFAAFAPFDNPQIAVYVLIPNGTTLTSTAPSSLVGRDVIAAYFGINNEAEEPVMVNKLAK